MPTVTCCHPRACSLATRSLSAACASGVSRSGLPKKVLSECATWKLPSHGMRNEILASKQKNEKYVPLTCRRDEGRRG